MSPSTFVALARNKVSEGDSIYLTQSKRR